MFYLLENNRIIDSKDYWEYAVGIDKDGKTCYRVDIKKQSENVFNLIEVGDLIKINFDTTDPTIIDVTYKESHFSTVAIKYYPETILAIYKPDSQGNYIKVWEKKDA